MTKDPPNPSPIISKVLIFGDTSIVVTIILPSVFNDLFPTVIMSEKGHDSNSVNPTTPSPGKLSEMFTAE